MTRSHSAWLIVVVWACGGSTVGTASDDAGASADAPRVDGTAGVIACGGATCDATHGELCCATYAPGTSPSCTASCPRGDSFACDGPEDCAGARCCAAVQNSGTHAVCRAACIRGSDLQLCHSDAECTDAPGGPARCCPVNGALFPGIGACDARCQ